MLFNSLEFLLIYLPLTLLGWFFISKKELKLTWIIVLSLVFYGYWNWRYVGLLLLSIVIDFYCGNRILSTLNTNKSASKKWMYVSIGANLFILGFFKYTDLILSSFNEFLPQSSHIELFNLLLPVGISFYTFQSMSYSIDLYRGDAPRAKSFLNFGAYVTMFPQMIAGPIVRYKTIVNQINYIPKGIDWERFHKGLFYFGIGLMRKVFLADTFAKVADPFFETFNYFDHSFFISWAGLLAYALQIFFDFSAYSEMAIGLGLMLGFNFPINFNSPYKARSFSDFWRRWHITLSTFLRDNLYIPMGGNRKGKKKMYLFLLITMLLGGLWHGASWLFLIWGALHGTYLAIERLILGTKIKKSFFYQLLVFIMVCVAWVFFRSPDMATAIGILKSCFMLNGVENLSPVNEIAGWKILPGFTDYIPFKHFAFLAFGLLIVFLFPNTNNLLEERKIQLRKGAGIMISILLILGLLLSFKNSPFIYFQF